MLSIKFCGSLTIKQRYKYGIHYCNSEENNFDDNQILLSEDNFEDLGTKCGLGYAYVQRLVRHVRIEYEMIMKNAEMYRRDNRGQPA